MNENRHQRRARRRRERAEGKRAQAAAPRTQDRVVRLGEASEHATLLVLNEPDWSPFQKSPEGYRDGAELWENSRYIVALYPPARQDVPEGFPRVVHLSFKHQHNIAVTDFRDMQRIKSELVGEEAMAVQIFPAESQLVDMANQYHLWVLVPDSWPDVPEGTDWPWLPFGFTGGRCVSARPPAGGRQRTFDADSQPDPADEARLEEHLRALVSRQSPTDAQLLAGCLDRKGDT